MPQHVLVTGGTGVLGTHVVRRLLVGGDRVRVLSRRPGRAGPDVESVAEDLRRPDGLEPALAGVDTVLHLAGTARGDGRKARHLVDAARRAGIGHLVFISVVGADRVPVVSARDRMAFGYYGEQRAAELAVEASGVPWTTLRATQFHDLLLRTARGLTAGPVGIAFAGVRFQPIEADEVAARLVELALAAPAGLVPNLAGPHAVPMVDLLRAYSAAAGRRRPLLQVATSGRAATAIRAGANLDLEHAVGRLTWEAFLTRRIAAVPGSGDPGRSGSRIP